MKKMVKIIDLLKQIRKRGSEIGKRRKEWKIMKKEMKKTN